MKLRTRRLAIAVAVTVDVQVPDHVTDQEVRDWLSGFVQQDTMDAMHDSVSNAVGLAPRGWRIHGSY